MSKDLMIIDVYTTSSNYSVHHLALPRAKREITFFIPPLQIRLKIVTFASASK